MIKILIAALLINAMGFSGYWLLALALVYVFDIFTLTVIIAAAIVVAMRILSSASKE